MELLALAGVDAPDGGRVIIPHGCRVGYVEQILDEKTLDVPLLEWVQAALPDWGDFWQEWEKAQSAGDEAAMNRLMARQHDLETRYGYNPEQRAQTVLSGLTKLEQRAGGDAFSCLLRCTGVILLADYARALCEEAGAESLAWCTALAGRVLVLAAAWPLLEEIGQKIGSIAG